MRLTQSIRLALGAALCLLPVSHLPIRGMTNQA